MIFDQNSGKLSFRTGEQLPRILRSLSGLEIRRTGAKLASGVVRTDRASLCIAAWTSWHQSAGEDVDAIDSVMIRAGVEELAEILWISHQDSIDSLEKIERVSTSLEHDTPRIPTSTYRLQFNRSSPLRRRGKLSRTSMRSGSVIYASPYFQASPESLHGYDITDHNKLNAAIGSREEYDAWIAELHAHGMGQIVDFVPNHMGSASRSTNGGWTCSKTVRVRLRALFRYPVAAAEVRSSR